MGATGFMIYATGSTPREAFDDAREKALHDWGHAGYTGTIAEKESYTTLKVPEGKTPQQHANDLMDTEDSAITDKWGPAGCIRMEDQVYMFFGFASC